MVIFGANRHLCWKRYEIGQSLLYSIQHS